LLHLGLHPLLQLAIPCRQLGALVLNGVVVALDPDERPDAGEQLGSIEGFCDEVVRTSFDGANPLFVAAGRDHHHR
jgi:hypothetical protein